MKKKLIALALGVVATCSVAFSQVLVTETINGQVVTGTVTNVNPNTTINVGTLITLVSNQTGNVFTLQVVTVPSNNPPGSLAAFIANAVNNAFNAANVLGAMPNGTLPASFGSNAGEYSLNFIRQENVPFDFGISAVLGAGAIAAVKTARKRKKEEAQIA